MKIGGRALISTVLLALMLVCASHAQDSVSITGIEAVREGDSAIIQLNTSGSADFRLDRFTIGNWVTVWSSRLSLPNGDDEEHELELDCSAISDLVTRATTVAGRHHGEVRFHLGDDVDMSAITIRRDGDTTVVVIPAAGTALPGGGGNLREPFQSGNSSGGSFFIPREDSVEESVEIEQPAIPVEAKETESGEEGHIDEGVLDPAGPAGMDAGTEDSSDPPFEQDRKPVAVLGVSSDFGTDTDDAADAADAALDIVEDVIIDTKDGMDAAVDQDGGSEELRATDTDATAAGATAVSAPSTANEEPARSGSGVAPGRFKTDEQVEFVRRSEKKPGIVVPPVEDGTDEAMDSIMPGVASASQQDSLASQANVNVQRTMGDTPPADEVDELVDDLKNGEVADMQPAAPAQGSSRISTPARDMDPYKPSAAFNLGGVPQPRTGKDALEDLAIELFQIVDTPLDQAFTLLFQQTDYNVIVDSSVGGENSVSLSFKDGSTNLRDALDLLTSTYGLDYVVNANTVVIASTEKMYGGLIDFETRVFVLNYADPQNVKDILLNTGVLGESQVEAYLGEQAFIGEGGGQTELSEEGENSITAKTIDTNISTTPRNAVVVKGTPAEIEYVARVIKEIDRKPKLVELEVRVCEANETALKNLGLQFNPDQEVPHIMQTWTEQFDTIDYWLDPEGSVDADQRRFQDFSIGSFDRNGLGFQAQLNLQLENGNVESLAQPTLNTVDGKQAIYFAGERIPYISSVTREQGQVTQEISFLPVGVTLNFKPRLDADDLITIDVNPVISSLTEFRIIGEVEAPRTTSRQLATTVRVQDGQPFVMAGLITNTERETISKIPMLGDLPLLGKLFRNKRKDGQRTEIIIVVTPRIYD